MYHVITLNGQGITTNLKTSVNETNFVRHIVLCEPHSCSLTQILCSASIAFLMKLVCQNFVTFTSNKAIMGSFANSRKLFLISIVLSTILSCTNIVYICIHISRWSIFDGNSTLFHAVYSVFALTILIVTGTLYVIFYLYLTTDMMSKWYTK